MKLWVLLILKSFEFIYIPYSDIINKWDYLWPKLTSFFEMSHWKASQVKIQVHLQKKFKIYSGIFKQFCNAILIFVWVLTKKDARSALLWSKFPIRLPRSVLKICEYFSSLFRYYLVNCWNKTLNRNKKLLWWKKIVVMISFVPFLYWIKHDGRHHFLSTWIQCAYTKLTTKAKKL